jgi:hypothetical protein
MSDISKTVFISHSSKNGGLARILQQEIIKALDIVDSRNVFVSSTPDAIGCSDEWFETVVKNLDEADALIVLIASESMKSNWVWFEIGHFWSSKGGQHIYPAYTDAGIKIPHPLSTKQAKHLNNSKEIKNFFDKLCEQFGGDSTKVDIDSIIAAYKPKGASVRVVKHNGWTRKRNKNVPRN